MINISPTMSTAGITRIGSCSGNLRPSLAAIPCDARNTVIKDATIPATTAPTSREALF
jgi:hypothetical protein